MPTPTLIVTLPDGTTATRSTARLYVSAVVFRCTEAEAEAAETELARYQAEASTEAGAREYAAKVAKLEEVYGRYQAAHQAAEAAGRFLPGNHPLWAERDRAYRAVTLSAGYQVHGCAAGGYGVAVGPAVGRARQARAAVGNVGVVQWNQRIDLSRDALATERGHHPLRELLIVPVTEAPAKAPKARK
jgi:hypothetical protein